MGEPRAVAAGVEGFEGAVGQKRRVAVLGAVEGGGAEALGAGQVGGGLRGVEVGHALGQRLGERVAAGAERADPGQRRLEAHLDDLAKAAGGLLIAGQVRVAGGEVAGVGRLIGVAEQRLPADHHGRHAGRRARRLPFMQQYELTLPSSRPPPAARLMELLAGQPRDRAR
jgi:hypothetical protein